MSWLKSIFGVQEGKNPVRQKTTRKYSGQSFAAVFSSKMTGSSGFDKAVSPLLKNNRTPLSGKNPMKFGIMQSTLRDYDPKGRIAENVSELTADKAREIYRKIWERSGSERLPEQLAVMHFKAYVQRPKTAVEALKRSEQDANSYRDALMTSAHIGLKTHHLRVTPVIKDIPPVAPAVKPVETQVAEPTASVVEKKPDMKLPVLPGWTQSVHTAIEAQALNFKKPETPKATGETAPDINPSEAIGHMMIFQPAQDFHEAEFNKTLPDDKGTVIKVFNGNPAVSIEKGRTLDREPEVLRNMNSLSGHPDFLAEGVVIKIRFKL